MSLLPKYLVITLFLLVVSLFTACQSDTNNANKNANKNMINTNELPQAGMWQATLQLTDEEKLPFNFDLKYVKNKPVVTIYNAEERIVVEEITFNEEERSFSMRLPVFDSEIKGKYASNRLFGAWHNYAKSSDYQLQFYAVADKETRFDPITLNDTLKVDGRWSVMFVTDDRSSKTDAIGEFKQEGNKVTATFLTPTGDYRFLEGDVTDSLLRLSCFDGAHAFLFKAHQQEKGDEDGLIGEFWSGSHWNEQWFAFRSDTATLADPNKLTYLKEGYDKVEFSFPNLANQQVSLKDERYQDKVVMVQILGSWCPNCMDEARLYADLYQKYHKKGLEVIGLAFETSETLAAAKPTLERYKKQLGIDYELLFAGKASKKVASEALPMLNKVISFPTTIFIDKKGEVRKIHTGFSGPATSKYEPFVKELEQFLEQLLAE